MSFPSRREFMALKRQVGDLEARIRALEGFEPPGVPEPESIPSIADTAQLYKLLGDQVAELLIDADPPLTSVEAVNAATDEELQAISGIGAGRIRTIRKQLGGA